MRDMPRAAERGAHQRVDPDYATTVEIFDNLTHHQIHTAIQQLAPATLLAGQQAWQNTATGLTDAVDQAHTEIRSAIADGWRGGAAQQAAAAVSDFELLGRQLADVMAVVGERLGQAGDAAEALRGAVPGPSDEEPDLAAALLDPARASDNVAAAKNIENSRQDVVRVMESIYTTAFIPTGTAVPAFPEAPAGAGVDAPAAAAAPGPVSIVVPDTGEGRPVSQPSAVTIVAAADQEPGTPDQPVAPVEEESTEPGAQAPVTIPAAAAPVVIAGTETAPQTPTTTPASATTAPASAAPVIATDRPAAMPTTAPAATMNSTASVAGVSSVPSNASTSDDQRKRDEKRQDSAGSGGDAIAGMSAGAMGGLMGGALAAADTTRPGPAPVAPKPAPANTDEFDDEDDDLHYVDDELTFLEPAGAGGELIGSLDPTTPPVLGEWTEHE
ncbi:hypothetical protein ACFXNW_16640 [Nocardia sp. NPDC059180]|uniref:PPE domain-containing protein n=1 Tax=Nocardia sp. NPDC059180 TaxID=3346761 RepID=UPI003686E292